MFITSSTFVSANFVCSLCLKEPFNVSDIDFSLQVRDLKLRKVRLIEEHNHIDQIRI